MTARWRRRIDPRYPYRAERAKGSDTWLSAAVASYSAAWQLLVPSYAVLLVLRDVTSAGPASWWMFSPSIASAVAGAWCALSHHLKDDASRWWGPWTVLVPAGSGLAYAVGLGRTAARRRRP